MATTKYKGKESDLLTRYTIRPGDIGVIGKKKRKSFANWRAYVPRLKAKRKVRWSERVDDIAYRRK